MKNQNDNTWKPSNQISRTNNQQKEGDQNKTKTKGDLIITEKYLIVF